MNIYDKARQAISLLKLMAENQDIIPDGITITVNAHVVDVSASNTAGECIGWHKKYQPECCNTSGCTGIKNETFRRHFKNKRRGIVPVGKRN